MSKIVKNNDSEITIYYDIGRCKIFGGKTLEVEYLKRAWGQDT